VNKIVFNLNMSFKVLAHLMVQEIQYLISQYRVTYKYFPILSTLLCERC